eukprot:CAMPEP_0183705638 /NCGR_PEP_ID=MMETSP0737-20130205/2686_1 /TAXON_ID=385413 /ORGANISM="Thalassiosira miniscula, Strain CCMP1093" /LENGTH=163 /DNA_ID=CAMNT_0025932841 /DNA_START=104 /DNA_END=592 /DNA_ORIENTATION=-
MTTPHPILTRIMMLFHLERTQRRVRHEVNIAPPSAVPAASAFFVRSETVVGDASPPSRPAARFEMDAIDEGRGRVVVVFFVASSRGGLFVGGAHAGGIDDDALSGFDHVVVALVEGWSCLEVVMTSLETTRVDICFRILYLVGSMMATMLAGRGLDVVSSWVW